MREGNGFCRQVETAGSDGGSDRDGETKEHSEFSALVGWAGGTKQILVLVRRFGICCTWRCRRLRYTCGSLFELLQHQQLFHRYPQIQGDIEQSTRMVAWGRANLIKKSGKRKYVNK